MSARLNPAEGKRRGHLFERLVVEEANRVFGEV